jgi:hypothetical protein
MKRSEAGSGRNTIPKIMSDLDRHGGCYNGRQNQIRLRWQKTGSEKSYRFGFFVVGFEELIKYPDRKA